MSNKIKEEQRNSEMLEYSRNIFWHEPEKQNLIKRLLKKIYDLEDEISLLKTNSSN
jgi:hypothetical protein